MNKRQLGVNIDHIATLRQARGTDYPSIVEAADIAQGAGADLITVHLREDRRHIQDHDVEALAERLTIRLNLEMAVSEEMIEIACKLKPSDVCLVPEKRQELTTEGGLDVVGSFDRVEQATDMLHRAGCRVSLFIDPQADQIEAAGEATVVVGIALPRRQFTGQQIDEALPAPGRHGRFLGVGVEVSEDQGRHVRGGARQGLDPVDQRPALGQAPLRPAALAAVDITRWRAATARFEMRSDNPEQRPGWRQEPPGDRVARVDAGDLAVAFEQAQAGRPIQQNAADHRLAALAQDLAIAP